MNLTPELLGSGAVGLIIILGALGNYMRTLKGGTNAGVPPPAAVALAHAEMVIQLRRIADGVDKFDGALRSIVPMGHDFTEAVAQIHKVLGPALVDSAKAQMQIASQREAELRDAVEDISDRLKAMEKTPARRRS